MKKRVEMKQQAPEARIKNFFEVALGYTKEEWSEAWLLDCKHAPASLPGNINIPKFIKNLMIIRICNETILEATSYREFVAGVSARNPM